MSLADGGAVFGGGGRGFLKPGGGPRGGGGVLVMLLLAAFDDIGDSTVSIRWLLALCIGGEEGTSSVSFHI